MKMSVNLVMSPLLGFTAASLKSAVALSVDNGRLGVGEGEEG